LARDTSVRSVVWTSTGKHFSACGDMQTILAGYADLNVLIRGVDDGRRLFRAFADFPKPLVAAVHGNSFGVATSLIFTADAIVTTPAVRLSDPHVHVGLVAGDGGCVTWPLSAGLARAKRRLLWGEALTGVRHTSSDWSQTWSTSRSRSARLHSNSQTGWRTSRRSPRRRPSARSTECWRQAQIRCWTPGSIWRRYPIEVPTRPKRSPLFKEKREGRWTGT
jgi:Enoyl-CoA hydratase/isomerase